MNCPKCKSTKRKIVSYDRVIVNRIMMIRNKWECAKCTNVFYVSFPEEQPRAATI